MIQENEQETENDYKLFRQQLFRHEPQQYNIISGSVVELPISYIVYNVTDVDSMIWSRKIAVYQGYDTSGPSVDRLKNIAYIIDSEDCPAGFARLRKFDPKSGKVLPVFMKKPKLPVGATEPPKGPSFPLFHHLALPIQPMKMFLDCLNPNLKMLSYLKLDQVLAICSPCWPKEASEWVTRNRISGWPSAELIDKVLGLGCFLVPKPHQRTPDDDTQWRFSFSRVELLLMRSWTNVQKYIYHVLRIIKSEILRGCGGTSKSVLCSYHVKTLMLWACEEKTAAFWREENVESSISELLRILTEWLTEKHISNYFIRENNMIDYSKGMHVDLTKEITALLEYREFGVTAVLSDFPRSLLASPLCLKVSANLIEAVLLIINNKYTPPDVYSEPIQSLLSSSEKFLPELRNLFLALRKQRHLMRVKGTGRELSCIDVSFVSENLNRLINAEDRGSIKFDTSLSVSITDILQGVPTLVHDQYRTVTSQDENENIPPEIASDQYSSAIKNGFQARSENKNENADLEQDYFSSADLTKAVMIAEMISDLLLSVAACFPSPTYYSGVAYYANFLYVTLNDNKSALEQCNKALPMFEKLRLNISWLPFELENSSISVSLSTAWSLLFDEYLQTIHGFLTLGDHVYNQANPTNVSGTNYVVQLCPCQFLRYISFQSSRKLRPLKPTELVFEVNFEKLISFPFSAERLIKLHSEIVLLAAIRISGISATKLKTVLTPGESSVWSPIRYLVQWPDPH